MLTKHDIGTIIIIGPQPWYRRFLHYVWFNLLRRKSLIKGSCKIVDVKDATTIVVQGCKPKTESELTVSTW